MHRQDVRIRHGSFLTSWLLCFHAMPFASHPSFFETPAEKMISMYTSLCCLLSLHYCAMMKIPTLFTNPEMIDSQREQKLGKFEEVLSEMQILTTQNRSHRKHISHMTMRKSKRKQTTRNTDLQFPSVHQTISHMHSSLISSPSVLL